MNEPKKFGFEELASKPIFEQTLFEFPKGPFLEIGCGLRPFLPDFLDLLGPVECIDTNESFIKECRKKYSNAEFSHKDVLALEAINKYAIILDGHLLHCLKSVEEYNQALKNIYRALRPGGIFLGETMISHSAMLFEPGFKYDPESFQLVKGKKPSRLILPSMRVEELLLASGFRIEFLKVHEGLRMIPHDNRDDPFPEDPQVMRFIASRSRNT